MQQAGAAHPLGVTAYIGVGGNLGTPEELRARLRSAVTSLARLPGTRVRAVSSLYASAPVEAEGPEFLNAVVGLATTLAPMPLLWHLQAIERTHQRERPFPNAPRTLDLDLLLHGSARLSTPELTVPHPRMAQRAFVLQPLAELCGLVNIAGLGPLPALLKAVSEQEIRLAEPASNWWPYRT